MVWVCWDRVMLIRSCSQALDHKRSISSSSKLPPILRDEICIRRASPTLIIASRDSGGGRSFVILVERSYACYAFVTKTLCFCYDNIRGDSQSSGSALAHSETRAVGGLISRPYCGRSTSVKKSRLFKQHSSGKNAPISSKRHIR
jgi:hypothetical protein